MAYTSYQQDLFVSYGHLDNPGEEEKGWIDRFHRDLDWRVSQVVGEQVSIWRDNSLDPGAIFEDELMGRIRNSAVLIPVLSPRYLKSRWCQRELQAFLDAAEKSGGLAIGNRPRVFKVIKSHVELKQEPLLLQKSLGFPFYREDESGTSREWPSRDDDGERKYTRKLDELAESIGKMLEAINTKGPVARPEMSIYLAEVSGDMTGYRDELKRELQSRGFGVLPESPLPLEWEDLCKEIRGTLTVKECVLSVHLVGSRYGVVPDGVDVTESKAWIQARLAGEREKNGSFRRLIWHPPDIQMTDGRQIGFIEAIQSNLRDQKNTEFLRVPFEGFKAHVLDRLKPVSAPRPQPACGSPKWIYLVCEPNDHRIAREIQSELEDQGYEVALPAREGDASALRNDHEETLRDCDAVLIYYGSGCEAWQRGKERDLRKSVLFGRKRAFLAQGVLLGPPDSEIKQDWRNAAFTLDRWVPAAGVAPNFLKHLSAGREVQA